MAVMMLIRLRCNQQPHRFLGFDDVVWWSSNSNLHPLPPPPLPTGPPVLTVCGWARRNISCTFVAVGQGGGCERGGWLPPHGKNKDPRKVANA